MQADPTRRSVLKLLAGSTAAAVAAGSFGAGASEADGLAGKRKRREYVGMLYDTTLCIGCKACVSACSATNEMPIDTGNSGGLWQEPSDLNAKTKNIIKVYKDKDSDQRSYIKRQCMHCIDPACASACMMHALQKDEKGIVFWEGHTCVGCRYCQVACPFGIPKFEWAAFNPKIVKCELCRHVLPKGEQPACCRVCPRGAVIYGKRDDLLAEAKRRITANPGRYYEDHVYGEFEAGGTQVLYLSHLPFDKLGLPILDNESLPEYVHKVQGTLYKGFVAPIAFYGACVYAMKRNQRKAEQQSAEHGQEG